MRSFVSVVLCTLIPFSILFSQNNKPLISKQPVWVTENKTEYSGTLDKEAEDGYINLSYEKQINLQEQAVFVKRSSKILSAAGVQKKSEVTVTFDPTYEQLLFHSIEIIRDGISINKLKAEKIKTIHTEPELDMYIYNGELQSTLILEDVRKGDVIQYSYTLKGFNRIFQNKFQQVFTTQLSVPVYNIYYMIIVPPSRKINIKNSNDTINPVISTENNGTVYEWKKSNIPALHVQDVLPDWYDPYPSVMISEFNSWSEVNNWAKMLFPYNVALPQALKDKINTINTEYKTPEAKTTAALRFVQDEIRYMGIEMGVHSHKPSDVSKIFNQRFGDCKEKSYLLCTMLRAMNIDACPVLINTEYKKAITEWLPAATDFDHCTVRVKINGKNYWLDPTISSQRGNLEDISFPDYQYGLVITDTTTSLSLIPPQGKNLQKIKEVFTVPWQYGPCYLKVITTFSGCYADEVRDDFNNNSNYEMQKSYLNFYKDYFDNIKADSLVYTDNDSTGIFTTTEYYSIDSFWTRKKGAWNANFTGYIINSLLGKPKETSRKMPIGLNYPVHYIEELDINLPGVNWNLKESNAEVECAAFAFKQSSKIYNNRIVITYDFKRFKDNVMPEETTDYFAALANVNSEEDYEISWGNSTDTFSTGNILGSFLIVAIVAGTIIWRKRRK